MKITWFGGTALRVYVGGEIIVVDPDTAAEDVDQAELESGADRVLALSNNVWPVIDAEAWRPRRAQSEIGGRTAPVEILSIGQGTALIDAPGEPPLLICDAPELPRMGRWVDRAVFVLFGARGARLAEAIVKLDLARPQPLILAADEQTLDAVFARLVDDLRDRGFTSLEPGLALEV